MITSLEGQPTPDEGAATAAITGAVGSGARRVRGTIVRGDRAIDVVVELPAQGP